MADLYITQYARQGRDDRGPLAAGEEPNLGTIVVTSGGASAVSVALDPKAKFLRLYATAPMTFAVGVAPVAVAPGPILPAASPEYFALEQSLVGGKNGCKIAGLSL